MDWDEHQGTKTFWWGGSDRTEMEDNEGLMSKRLPQQLRIYACDNQDPKFSCFRNQKRGGSVG